MFPAVSIEERYDAAIAAVAALPGDVLEHRGLDNASALRVSQKHAELARLVGAKGAVVAGDLAYRSRPELGGEGLARKTGHRTVQNLIKATTGAPKEQVIATVNAGTLLVETVDDGRADVVTGEVKQSSQPWLKPVAVALAAGEILPAASESIARGLGEPNSVITSNQLESAAATLVANAVAGVDADRLRRNAQDLRLELNVAEVKLREAESLTLRGLTHHSLPEGGGVAVWRMDVETYAHFVETYDRATSPKLGGVRFVDPAKQHKADKIAQDPRTFKQLASDTFLHLLQAGADADPTVLLGSGAPIIRVTVPAEALESGVGFGRIDGQSQPISIESVKRLMETGKTIRMGFDPNGTYLEVFDDPLAENRLYNTRQREILAAKFGGCMFPGCDRPPSWTEAHHIQYVKRDNGKTTIANAILLCKHHHLLVHNDHYEIALTDNGTYWLIPPTDVDPDQTPIEMPLKTRNLIDLRTAKARATTLLGASVASAL